MVYGVVWNMVQCMGYGMVLYGIVWCGICFVWYIVYDVVWSVVQCMGSGMVSDGV